MRTRTTDSLYAAITGPTAVHTAGLDTCGGVGRKIGGHFRALAEATMRCAKTDRTRPSHTLASRFLANKARGERYNGVRTLGAQCCHTYPDRESGGHIREAAAFNLR